MLLPKPGIHGPKPVGHGPSGSVLVLGPDRDRKIFRNLGPVRTRTEKVLEIPYRSVPGPGDPWISGWHGDILKEEPGVLKKASKDKK